MKGVRITPPISATGKRRTSRGFTLIELMVVVLIIGLISSVVVLNLPGRDDQAAMRRLAESMVAQFRLLRSEAVFSGSTLGLAWRPDGQRVLQLSADGWRQPLRDIPYRNQVVPDTIALTLERDGAPVDLARNSESPQIVFLNDGQVTPFVLTLRDRNGEEIQFSEALTLDPDPDSESESDS